MFGLFKRWSGPKPPTYDLWQSDASRWEGVWKSVQRRSGDGRLIFVVHFDETLAVLHELLDQDGIVAHDLERPQQPSDLCKLPPGLYVTRASMLVAQTENKIPSANTILKIIAVEPHLMPEPDAHLRSVLAPIRGDVLAEHHASLDDLALRTFAAQRTLELLSKAGFKDGDCLHSPLVSRAIRNAQNKLSQLEGIDPTAQSLTEWETQLPGFDAR